MTKPSGRGRGVGSRRWLSQGRRGRQASKTRPLESFGELGRWAVAYFEDRQLHNYSRTDVVRGTKDIRRFLLWCEERALGDPRQITRADLERYQRSLFSYRKRDGRPLAVRTQYAMVLLLRSFFRWLARRDVLLFSPAAELELPRLDAVLPRQVLNAEEMERVLLVPDVATAQGLRDRAMLETLYSTGVRRAELANLDRYDVDLRRGTVLVRQGKGNKDRVVPIGARAAGWVEKYLVEARPQLLRSYVSEALFVSSYGDRLSLEYIGTLVRRHIAAAELGKGGSCHLIRHSVATLMLENGADIRFVQAMLGHASIQSTEIYTHVAITKLKEVHERTHPSAKLGRNDATATVDEQARSALFSSLAAEDRDDEESDRV